MKKNLTAYLAIFASLVFAFSCAKEEGGQEAPITPDTITVSLSLDENNKSIFTDSEGLRWTNTDQLRWISADGSKTATSTNISITNKGYNATFTIEIPGLSGADQTGHFTVNSEDNGSFKFTKSGLSGTDMTIAQEEIGKMNSTYTFLHSGKNITITKGTTSLTDDQAKLAMAGSIIRAIPYTTTHNSEKVLSVSFRSLDNVAGTIAYSYTTSGSTSSGITADAATRYLVNLTAPFSLEGITDKNSSHAIYIPVPTATIKGYRITVETDQAFYMFDTDNDLTLTENKVRNVSLNLDNADVAVAPKKAQFDLSACTVSTFPALQYVTIGYSPDGDGSTNRTITDAEKTTRKNKYDTASNLWDNDASTCVHTNFDINTPDGSWALRDGVLQNDNYIQISLDKTIGKNFDLFIKNTDSGHYLGNWGGSAQGVDVKVSEDGNTFEKVASCPLYFTGTASFSSECTWYDLSASTIQNINHIRILATNGCTSAGTYYGQQGKERAGNFGIAEIKIWSVNSTEPSYKVPVESVSVEPAEITLSPGGTVQLSAKVLPTDAYNKNVTWSSSNEAVATVNASGYVEAIAVGTATITATTVQGGKTATCAITVSKEFAKISLSSDMVSSNYAMQYSYELQGCNIYGFSGSPDWCKYITDTHKTNRENKYGKAGNMWDNDNSTCYHTNVDFAYGYGNWAVRATKNNQNHYIQFDLKKTYSSIKIDSIKNPSDSYVNTGYKVQISSDGSAYSDACNISCGGSGASGSSGIINGPIQYIRFRPNGGATCNLMDGCNQVYNKSEWTTYYNGPAFGIAELSISGIE